MELERRVHAVLGDNEQLQNALEDQRERTLVLEKQCQEKDQQVFVPVFVKPKKYTIFLRQRSRSRNLSCSSSLLLFVSNSCSSLSSIDVRCCGCNGLCDASLQ